MFSISEKEDTSNKPHHVKSGTSMQHDDKFVKY